VIRFFKEKKTAKYIKQMHCRCDMRATLPDN